jgi:Fe2+ or Zn2+ uptake regulation protein
MENIDLFKAFLNKQQLSVTQERIEIASIIAGFKKCLFNVEDIYSAMNKRNFKIARSTVYRNIKLLRSAGLLEAVLTGQKNKKSYRNISPQRISCRLCCLDCDFEEDIKDEQLETLIFNICEKHDVEKFGVVVRIEGRKCSPWQVEQNK